MDPTLVLDTWLGLRDAEMPDGARIARWFVADPVVDESIRSNFEAAVEEALAGGFQEWESDPKERVALVVLVDQFPRNLYRDEPKSFSGDARAMRLTRRSTQTELISLHPLEHYFMLLPWMHAEDLDDQRRGEAAFAFAIANASSIFRPLFENGLDYATKHRRVIERFDRFPHRNAILGRESTPEELDFIRDVGTGF